MMHTENLPIKQIAVAATCFSIGVAAYKLYKKRSRQNWIVVPAVKEVEEDDMTLFDNKDLSPRKEFTGVESTFGVKTGISGGKENKDGVSNDPPVWTPEEIKVVLTPTDQWVWDDEVASRGGAEPYVLHYQEFIENESGFSQETVTFYQKDTIVADSLDEKIERHAKIMGALKFGHGSNDPNVVYIRNPKLKMEWEVLLHPSSFSEEILGESIAEEVETEIRHSYTTRRFRSDD